jgi:hypothetical protein
MFSERSRLKTTDIAQPKCSFISGSCNPFVASVLRNKNKSGLNHMIYEIKEQKNACD